MGIEATNTVSTQIEMKVGLTRKEVEHTNNSEAIKLFDLLDKNKSSNVNTFIEINPQNLS